MQNVPFQMTFLSYYAWAFSLQVKIVNASHLQLLRSPLFHSLTNHAKLVILVCTTRWGHFVVSSMSKVLQNLIQSILSLTKLLIPVLIIKKGFATALTLVMTMIAWTHLVSSIMFLWQGPTMICGRAINFCSIQFEWGFLKSEGKI
jgi:hypothetical protein